MPEQSEGPRPQEQSTHAQPDHAQDVATGEGMPERPEKDTRTSAEGSFTAIPAPEKPISSSQEFSPAAPSPDVQPGPMEVNEKPEEPELVAPTPSAEIEGAPEKELINKEKAGVQAMLLSDGEIPDEASIKIQAEKIKNGERPKLDNVRKSSYNQRDEAWDKEGYKLSKDMTKEEAAAVKEKRMKSWEKSMNNRLNELKGTPQAEFLKRIGLDIENGANAKAIYQKFMVDEKGDLGYFADQVAKNNTEEQIEAQREFIMEFAEIYGKDSKETASLLAEGVKNVRNSPNKFSEAALEAIQKGEDMPGLGVVETMREHSRRWDGKVQTGKEIKEEEEAKAAVAQAEADAKAEEEKTKKEGEETEKTEEAREGLEIEEAKKLLTEEEKAKIAEKFKEARAQAITTKEHEDMTAARIQFAEKEKDTREKLQEEMARDEKFTIDMANEKYSDFIKEHQGELEDIDKKSRQGVLLFDTKKDFIHALLTLVPEEKIKDAIESVKPQVEQLEKHDREPSYAIQFIKEIQPDGTEKIVWLPGAITKQQPQ